MKGYFKNKLPDKSKVHEIKVLQKLNIAKSSLWGFSRRSVAMAFLIGFFWMMIPIPFQMVPATICAIYFGANLPITLVLVWITNPITMPFFLYLNYRLGVLLLGGQMNNIDFTSLHSVLEIINPLLLGSLVSGTLLGVLGYYLVNWIYIFLVKSSQNKRIWRKNKGKLNP